MAPFVLLAPAMRALLLSLIAVAPSVFADASLPEAAPGAREPDELRCGGDDWIAIRRAVAAWCEARDADEGCAPVRRALRACDENTLFSRTGPGEYVAGVSTDDGWFDVTLLRRRDRWRVEAIAREECG